MAEPRSSDDAQSCSGVVIQQPEEQTLWTVLAQLLRPQGRKGELLADLQTDFPERFTPGSEVFLAPPHFTGPRSDAIVRKVVSSWLPQGRNAGRIVLEFSGTTTIEAAERLIGLDVVVPEAERSELRDGSIYIDELIGCVLLNGGVGVGKVSDVQFMMTPDGKRRLSESTPLLTVEMDEGEALIPFARAYLVSVDLAEKSISMNLPKGLLELNLGLTKPDLKAKSESE